jgi:hypothetical protein
VAFEDGFNPTRFHHVPEDEGAARARSIRALAYLARPSDPEAMITLIVDLLARDRRADGFLAQALEAARRTAETRSGSGPTGEQQPSGAPQNGEEQNGCSGEHSQSAH